MPNVLVLGFLLALSAHAEDVGVPAPPGELRGTLLDAGKKMPPVLIIAGSGPTDRDGNNKGGLHSDTYRKLAEDLASKGISSLRYDKRGVGASASARIQQSDLRIRIYADDAARMAAELRKRMQARCVWLIGHSEGALLAELAAQKPDGICGLVLISGAGRKAGDVLQEQLAAMTEPDRDLAQAALAELAAGRLVPHPPSKPPGLFYPDIQPYLIDWMLLNPATLLASIRLPVLVLQGENDIQVSVEDARRLAVARPGAKLVVLPGVNHMLKSSSPDRIANLASYADPTLPLAPGVVDAIADFVQKR